MPKRKLELVSDPDDKGHRFGNFHQYYDFHPIRERLSMLEGVLDEVVSNAGTTFEYLDVGCNEGDLTLGIGEALRHRMLQSPRPEGASGQLVRVHGLDIDPVLIERARKKSMKGVEAIFEVQNVLDAKELPRADLVSLFSTTMWLHIHGGDEGLRSALSRMCKAARRYLVIEAQPSKCYRNTVVRLRRMNRPEVDVSSDRLEMRLDIEEQVHQHLLSESFQLVERASEEGKRTSWQRAIRLYKRVQK